MIVEIWSDVVCPWCYIGKRRFERALERFSAANPEVEVEVRYRAFMLDPTAPVGVSQPVREVYERKFGGPHGADEVLDRVTSEAAGEGLEFRMEIARRSNTLLAHRLLVLAERLGCQAELKERLLAAYFTEGREVGDQETLIELAAEVGIEPAEARDWLDDGRGKDEVGDHLEFAAANGLMHVPTFVFDREAAIPGAQEADVFLEMLERRLAAANA
ncbi:MAG: DsbA family oxidoreductase [Acidimicrobiia bacterium]|nr:DsbA family oxidoreductase [Acidimicrobiia bacterium]